MQVLLIAIAAGVAFLVAYHTYGKWLGRKVFNLAADAVCPSVRLRDDQDYVPTKRGIVFGHHFTSIAGTGPIVGPAIAVIWGWVPALLWVVFGSIFIGAVHDFGALVVSLRNNGQTVGDIAGRVLNKRVRLLFLIVLFMALTVVLAIFGLVIGNVFKLYPASIFPCLIQVPIAVVIGLWLHRKGVNLLLPSLIALAVMYLTVVFGDVGFLHSINMWLASWPIVVWVAVLLLYSYVASVLPVWTLLQPRDYINSLQLLTALGLIVLGLGVAAFVGGASPGPGVAGQELRIVAPAFKFDPEGAPLLFPFLFITIACGAISGFHCLVSSGTSSKQLEHEPDARFVGYGAMLTEGFLATLVILACVAGLGLGVSKSQAVNTFGGLSLTADGAVVDSVTGGGAVAGQTVRVGDSDVWDSLSADGATLTTTTAGVAAWDTRYGSWGAANGLAAKVGAFVDGAANFLKAIGLPAGVAVALMGVLVASFAGTTLDTACRLQRYVVQELAATFIRQPGPRECAQCGYDLTMNVSGVCPECGADLGLAGDAQRPAGVAGAEARDGTQAGTRDAARRPLNVLNPLAWLRNKHGATVFAVLVAAVMAAMPAPGGYRFTTFWGAWTTGYQEEPRGGKYIPEVVEPGFYAAYLWLSTYGGKGGLILWPMFGATNQLLGGLAFLVIGFWLWRRGKPVWFLVLPMLFMLVMPAWAMLSQLPAWWAPDSLGGRNWLLIVIAVATLALEAWMLVEAALLWPRVKGVVERGALDHAGNAAATPV